MLNYGNLSDVEFEYLCQDVMSKMLNLNFNRFAPGRDGGIDLYSYDEKIIVQVKHYWISPVASLIASLKKEKVKIKENSPLQYYVCCSKQLSKEKIKEIYSMFSEYMLSEKNVITLSEIDDFLNNPENMDILKKHYKLWLSSTSVMEDIFTKDICIDCESLLSNIEEEERLFVKTTAYDYALKCLSKNRCLLITGNPGVGKTVLSKMLILHFVASGYRVRYTTDGNNLSSLKKSISHSQETKEVILLDDCLGQAYFNMKETQENELLAIIRYVKLHNNKVLILNSRVTIFQEANERTPLMVRSMELKEYKVFFINMDATSDLEKANILYNHFYFNDIQKPYIDEIKKDRRYLEIIKHKNYNPRIIEFVTNPNRISEIRPGNYYAFIQKNLNNPSKVWEDEYIRRLTSIDRILLTTLYSITNTTVQYEFVKKCFEYRISNDSKIDYSLNNFSNAINHLQKSFITIVDVNDVKMLSMVNPSVNDFIFSYLENNKLEKESIISRCYSVKQYRRMLDKSLFEKYIQRAFSERTIIDFVFENQKQKNGFITYYIAATKICDVVYTSFVKQYLLDIDDVVIFDENKVNAIEIVKNLVDNGLVQFYNLDDFFCDMKKLESMLSIFNFESLIDLISSIDNIYVGELRINYIHLCKRVLENAIELYCEEIEIDEFDLDVEGIMERCSHYYGDTGPHLDTEEASIEVNKNISNIVLDDIKRYLCNLPIDIKISIESFNKLLIRASVCDSFIEDYLKIYYEGYIDDNDSYHYQDCSDETALIDIIFNR